MKIIIEINIPDENITETQATSMAVRICQHAENELDQTKFRNEYEVTYQLEQKVNQ